MASGTIVGSTQMSRARELADVATKVQTASMRAQSLDAAMTNVLDQVSVSLFETPEAGGEEAAPVEDVEEMLAEEAAGEETSVDEETRRPFGRLEQKLKVGS